MYAIVVGCGRVGSAVAAALSAAGHSVVAIDHDQRALDDLPPEYSGFRLTGSGTEPSVLDRARIANSDALIAVTGDDNVNAMIAQAGKAVHGVTMVLARVNDPGRAALLEAMHIGIVSPTRLARDALVARVLSEGRA